MNTQEYTPDDFESCLAVFDTNVPEFFRTEEREEYSSFLRALPGPYLVLLDEAGRVVACGGYAVPEGSASADLCWGMVRRELQGRGYGRVLTQLRIERVLHDPTVLEISLNTSQHTAGFYEGLGFSTTEVEEDGYGPGLDRCEMRLIAARPRTSSG